MKTLISCIIFIICLIILFPWLIFVAIHIKKISYYQRKIAEGKVKTKIYARKCSIKRIDNKKEAKDFIKQNHKYGQFVLALMMKKFKEHKVCGAYYNNELVYLLALKPAENNWYCYVMCSKIDVIVTGAASKLLSRFNEEYPNGYIDTYSINRKSKIYEILNFTKVRKCTLIDMAFKRDNYSKTKQGFTTLWRLYR